MDNFIFLFSNERRFKIDNLRKIKDANSFFQKIRTELGQSDDASILTLYIGNLSRSRQIMNQIRNRLNQGKRTRIIIDYNRSRENTEALGLIDKYGIRKTFHFANKGIFNILPNFICEILSVLHMKIYIFDSKVILTGANMDDIYFTTRLDRYFIIENVDLAKYIRSEIFDRFYGQESGLSCLWNARINDDIKDQSHIDGKEDKELQRGEFSSLSLPEQANNHINSESDLTENRNIEMQRNIPVPSSEHKDDNEPHRSNLNRQPTINLSMVNHTCDQRTCNSNTNVPPTSGGSSTTKKYIHKECAPCTDQNVSVKGNLKIIHQDDNSTTNNLVNGIKTTNQNNDREIYDEHSCASQEEDINTCLCNKTHLKSESCHHLMAMSQLTDDTDLHDRLKNRNSVDSTMSSSDPTISIDHFLSNTQLIPYFNHQEENFIEKIFTYDFDEIFLSTAYINIPDEYIKHMKNRNCTFIIPDTQCNTFGGKGLFNKMIVSVYDYLNLQMFHKLPSVRFLTFKKKKISFHFKGIWAFSKEFAISIIGSSNFNERSHRKDKELCFLMITEDQSLINQFKSEKNWLIKHTVPYNPNQRPNLFIIFIAYLFKYFF